jgi:hypothetical protein
MHIRSRTFLLLCVVALAGCSSAKDDGSTASGASRTTTSRVAAASNVQPQLPAGTHTCTTVMREGPGPGSSVDWIVDGEPGNEWQLPAAPSRTIRIRATVHPNAVVSRVDFVVTPSDGGASNDDGPVIGSFQSWGPGSHEVSLRWDGRDHDGTPIPAGHYQLYANTSESAYQPVPCADGSSNGVELQGGGGFGYGIGQLLVPAQHS